MVKIRKIIDMVIAVLIMGQITACVSTQDNTMEETGNFREVFGLARAVIPSESKLPQTVEDWKIITDKIENGKVDESVYLATFSDAWPKEYDKLVVRQQHFSALFESTNYALGGLSSSKELNAIWQKMLEEIEQQQTEKKTTKD